ncbi:MAG: hypothetical protein J1E36_06475 [Eubacterium sp.]|nr:hypothetical protein [Eubacterium sp.]
MKKRIVITASVVIAVLCILLFSSCSNSENENQITADNIVNSIETAIKKDGNSDDVVLSVGNNDITKQDFICFCKFNADVADSSDYLSQEIIKETVKDIAFAKEAEQRGIKISDEEMSEIDNYTVEYVQDKYGADYPLETYKEICRNVYLDMEISDMIQDEILSSTISIDDKRTKKLCNDLADYLKYAENNSANWSDEKREEGMGEYIVKYYDVENAYIDYLIATHLSV